MISVTKSLVRAVLMSLILTKEKGGPIHLNYPSPSCKWLDSGSKPGMIKTSCVRAVPGPQERGQGRTHPIPTLLDG
jgi:hypothetical protein